MEQMITEDWYKNLFRLLNSPRPEASAEIKKICDDLSIMYQQRGITEYFPSIPGDSVISPVEGNADFIPAASRKFEKPIAPIRKDSLATDRSSPHLAMLRSNSPRLSLVPTEGTTSGSKSVAVSNDTQQRSEANEASTGSTTDDGSSVSSIAPTSVQRSSGSARTSSDADQATRKRDVDRRTRSDETTPTVTQDEPSEKKPKVVLDVPVSIVVTPDSVQGKQTKNDAIPDPGVEKGDFDGLACVICKTYALVSSGNLIVECHKCHNMYHQKCHQPNVPTSQIMDPRMLWYCNQCEKKNRSGNDAPAAMVSKTAAIANAGRRTAGAGTKDEKKPAADVQGLKRNSVVDSKEKQSANPLSAWASASASKPPSTAELLNKAATFLEKNKKKVVVPNSPQKPTSGNTNPFAMALSSASTGLAKLASSPTTTAGGLSKLAGSIQQQASNVANTKQSSIATAATSSSSTSTANAVKQLPTSSSQQMQAAAEKRLQMMKKKAAMKGSYRM